MEHGCLKGNLLLEMHPFLPKPLLLGTRGTLNTIGVVVLIVLFLGLFFFTNHLQKTCRANVNMACPTSRQSSPFWWSQFLEAATKKACKNKSCDGPKKKCITPKKTSYTSSFLWKKHCGFVWDVVKKKKNWGCCISFTLSQQKIIWFIMNIVYQAGCSPFVWWFEEVGPLHFTNEKREIS